MSEVSKELVEKTYELLELAKNTGKVKKGTNEVTKAVERGVAKLAVYAEDVSPKEIIMHIAPLCEEKGIACIGVPSKKELGSSLGIEVPSAAAAVIDAGEGKTLLKEIVDSLRKE